MPIPVESFFLAPNTEGTLQQQIRLMVLDGILTNRFPAGVRLPSSRQLAEHLGISRITVTLAYTDLVASEYLVSKGRSGYFVSGNAPRKPVFNIETKTEKPSIDWNKALGNRFSGNENLTRPANWRSYPYPFIYGQADPRLFDHQNWRSCALQALGQKDFEALTTDYYEQDDPMLVEYILRNLLPRRGIRAKPEEILITMGAQNALWMAAQILLTQRRTAVHENPCYPGLRQILEQTRCMTVALDVDSGGLNPDSLPPDVDAVFTTASHHCPTNVTMPIARRRQLLSKAANDGFVIVEDDYEFEISFGNATTPALKAIDETGSVVYVGSFSKSLFPGLRLGYIVADKEFIKEARALRGLVLRHPPGHIQRTAAYFLSLGYYDSQINRMARTYRRRRTEMQTAMRECGLGNGDIAANGGSSFWIKAPNGVDTSRLAKDLLTKGVVIEPGRVFFPKEQDIHTHFRISYSSIETKSIADGIRQIAEQMGSSGYMRQ